MCRNCLGCQMLKRKQTRVDINLMGKLRECCSSWFYSWYGYIFFASYSSRMPKYSSLKSNEISTYQYYFNMMECQASLQMPLECSCWVIYGIPKNPICVHYTVGNNYNGFNGHILFNFKHAKQRAFLLVQNATKDNKRKWQQLFTSITKIRLWYSVYFKCSDVKTKDQ